MKPPGTLAGSGSIPGLRPRFPGRHQPRTSNIPISNREKEACFFAPSRGGCFSPPAFRPRLPARVPPPEIELQKVPSLKNSNRERLRLETVATPTNQTPALHPNREKEARLRQAKLGSPVGEGVHHPPGLALGVSPVRRIKDPNTPIDPPKTGRKSKSAPSRIVSINNEADHLFCSSYGRF
jgi:hypothetical protein